MSKLPSIFYLFVLKLTIGTICLTLYVLNNLRIALSQIALLFTTKQ